ARRADGVDGDGCGRVRSVDVAQPAGRILVDVAREVGHRLVLRGLHVELAVAHHARTGRDQLADDDVLLETDQVVALAVDGAFGETPGGLAERRPRRPRPRG